ncbi:MAG: Ig-like domain-containing protein [Arenicella sp.]
MNIIFLLISKRSVSMPLAFLSLFFMSSSVFAYCSSKGNNTNYEWLERVDIGSFSHVSGSNGGYSDNTQQVINLAPGAVAISLTPGFRSSSYNEHWRVWIDFNQDDAFQSTEQVYSGSSSSALNGSIVIPNDAQSGQTRMRISMRYGGAPTSCGSFTYGEVEDYTVVLDVVDSSAPIVVATTPVDTTTDVDSNTSISITFSEEIDPLTVNQNSVSLTSQGQAIAGNVSSNGAVVTFVPTEPLMASTAYDVVATGMADLAGNPFMGDALWSFITEAPDVTAPTVSSTSPDSGASDVNTNFVVQVLFSEAMDSQTFNASTFSVSNGASNHPGNINVSGNRVQFTPSTPFDYSTVYTVRVAGSVSDLNGNVLGQEMSFDFTTKAFEQNYCSASGQNVSFFWVDSVRVGNFTSGFQSSSFSGYRNNTSTVFDVSRFYNLLHLKPAYSGYQYPVFWSVFIDYNQDGDFSDEELIFAGNGTGLVDGDFSIPDSALGGYTRMRVAMKYGSTASACETFSYGQVVDFRVQIPELVIDNIAPTVESISPADNAIDVNLSSDITVQFSEQLNPLTVNAQNILVSNAAGVLGNNIDFDEQNNVLTIDPYVPFDEGISYTVELGSGLEDFAGNSLSNTFVSTFTTLAGPNDIFSISGNVSAFGTPLQGISINVIGDSSFSAISSNVGTFSFDDLPVGTYTVSASKPGYTFTPASVVIDLVDADVSSVEFIGEPIPQPFNNGDFESGDFSGFTLYETNNGHTVTSVLMTNTTDNGASSYAAQIAAGVSGTNHIGNPGGGGFYQTISLQNGDLNIDMDIAAVANNGNGDGGKIEVFFDGVSLGSHDFGPLNPAVKKYSTLSLNVTGVTEGAHELRIESTREYLTGAVYHQIDNISISGTSVTE